MAVKIEKKREFGSQSLILSLESATKIIDNNIAHAAGETKDIGTAEDFRERMMLENEIRGHLPFTIRRINGKKIYEYSIEGLSSLEEESERKLGFEKIRSLARGLSDVVEAGIPFLLKEEDYVITPETVFFDKKNRDVKLVYCPGYGENFKKHLGDLMEYCLDMIDYNDGLAVRSSYGLYMKVRDGCSLKQMKEFVDEADDDRETEEEPEPETEEETKPVNNRETVRWNMSKYPIDVPEKLDEKRSPIEWIRDFLIIADKQTKMTIVMCTGAYLILTVAVISGKIRAFHRTFAGIPLWVPLMIVMAVICVVLMIRSVRPIIKILKHTDIKDGSADDNETVLLMGNGKQESLVLVSDGMPGLCTDRFPCVIGKDKASCDLIVDAKGVSRKHLKLDRNREGGVTIEDLNTINGTFLNGHKLAPNMMFEVREGDEISFGSVSYYINHLN
ncbi:MAG: FHA domain-containing protein [Lachnospiraceae bacterium]|nr:FHA domain-containing protein [Lachnospiraceae bacterium]